jgi:LacI family transcriptional regulator
VLERTMTVACMVPDVTNPFYPALMRGIQSVCEAQGYDVIAVNTDGVPDGERHFLSWSLQGRVDGVIGVFWTLRAADFRPVVEAGVPVVRIGSARKETGDIALVNILVDSRAGSYAMVHLADLQVGRGPLRRGQRLSSRQLQEVLRHL